MYKVTWTNPDTKDTQLVYLNDPFLFITGMWQAFGRRIPVKVTPVKTRKLVGIQIIEYGPDTWIAREVFR